MQELRERTGLNRQQLSSALGIKPRTWQRYEREGKRPESIATVIRLAVLANCSVDEALRSMGFEFPEASTLLAKPETADQ